jgi:hypothetical protein
MRISSVLLIFATVLMLAGSPCFAVTILNAQRGLIAQASVFFGIGLPDANDIETESVGVFRPGDTFPLGTWDKTVDADASLNGQSASVDTVFRSFVDSNQFVFDCNVHTITNGSEARADGGCMLDVFFTLDKAQSFWVSTTAPFSEQVGSPLDDRLEIFKVLGPEIAFVRSPTPVRLRLSAGSYQLHAERYFTNEGASGETILDIRALSTFTAIQDPPVPVPEPSASSLVALALAGLLGFASSNSRRSG